MRIVTAVLVVFSLLVVVPCMGATREIGSSEAKGLMEKNKKIVLLDVRTPQEFKQGRLAGALLIPLGELERRLGEVPKDRPVIVYCAVGSRSRVAAEILMRRGYKDVYNMSDGIVGWYRHGFQVLR